MVVLIFAERLKLESIHLQMDNHQGLLAYIRKKGEGRGGGYSERKNEFLIGNLIAITVEYLPRKLNTLADKESRKKDSSEWKVNPRIFQKLCYARGCQEIDLFATRLTTQLKAYFSWRTDHLSQGADAFQQSWKNLKGYAFPPFSLVGLVLKKFQKEQASLLLIAPVTSIVSIPLADVHKKSDFVARVGENHSLAQNNFLQLVA